jgi:hypothetical protein
MSSSTWRVLSGYAKYQRTPMRMTSGGKWAPLKQIAIVALPHDARLLREEDDTSKRLQQYCGQNLGRLFGKNAIVTKGFIIRTGFL